MNFAPLPRPDGYPHALRVSRGITRALGRDLSPVCETLGTAQQSDQEGGVGACTHMDGPHFSHNPAGAILPIPTKDGSVMSGVIGDTNVPPFQIVDPMTIDRIATFETSISFK